MRSVAVVAIAAESALGRGGEAYAVGPLAGRPETRIVFDAGLAEAGLEKPFVARARLETPSCVDRAALLLERVALDLVAELDVKLPDWRSRRVGIAVGTSSGGMQPLTELLERRARGEVVPVPLARAATYYGPLSALDGVLAVRPRERVQVLSACASSGIALGLACRWLELGRADLVIAGGYDAVTPFVAAGFESLGATSATRPAPFRSGRDGMALGEGAVLFVLVRASESTTRVVGYINGFAASCDAVHVTAPDREGRGLVRAALDSIADAGLSPDSIDLVSAHATATPFNDAAEAKAFNAVFGTRIRDIVVHPFKAVVGHTLGASSALEAAAVLDAMRLGMLPAAIGAGELDPQTSVRLLEHNEVGHAHHALKVSAAFGGANACIVVSRAPGHGPPLVPSLVSLVAVGSYKSARDLDAVGDRTRIAKVQLSRVDALSAAAVAATASVLERATTLPLARTGVVVGTGAATLENNEAFHEGLRGRGARGAQPRRFPPTSPNLAAGQCSIAFGFLGPSLSVGAGPEAPIEALLVAFDLLEAGDADAMIVVAAEHVGAVVLDVFRAAGRPPPVDGAIAAVLRRSSAHGLVRSRLSAILAEVRAADGVRGEHGPGWPVLRQVLLELGSQ